MNNGKKMEQDFILAVNDHYFHELNDNLKRFILFAFIDVDKNSKFICKKMKNLQKADIYIKHCTTVKYISLKSGSQNSVHVEEINSFVKFLTELSYDSDTINNLKLYHFGDNSTDGSGNIRYSAEVCKLKYEKEIFKFNNKINYSTNLSKIIERFILTGSKKTNKYVDIIYYGDVNIGTWCSSKELLKYCLRNKSMYMKTPHFCFLTYQNWCRNISKTKKSEAHRYYMQIKWFSILSDINKIRKYYDN